MSLRFGTKLYLTAAGAFLLGVVYETLRHSYLIVSVGTVLMGVVILALFLFVYVPLVLYFRGKL